MSNSRQTTLGDLLAKLQYFADGGVPLDAVVRIDCDDNCPEFTDFTVANYQHADGTSVIDFEVYREDKEEEGDLT